MSVRSVALQRFVGNEIPSGVIDGLNKDFLILNTPINGSLIVRLSGLVQVPGVTKDYTLTGLTISFNKAPKIGQEVVINYFTT